MNLSPTPRAFWLGLLLLLCTHIPLRAEQFGLITYEVFTGTSVTITRYPTNATGLLEIPAEIAGLPVTSIHEYAFYNCSGLAGVTIPSSVTSVGLGAFWGCSGLKDVTLLQGFTRIGPSMFHGCTGLTRVTIPSSVSIIENDAFDKCTRLHSYEAAIGNPHYSSMEGVLFNARQTILIKYPPAKVGPYSPPSSVTSIGSYSFLDSTRLTSITIPASVTSIEDNAFSGCNGLTGITIPTSVTSIGMHAFRGCTRLESIDVDNVNLHYSSVAGVLFNAEQTILIRHPPAKAGPYSIPSSVSTVGAHAFLECNGLTSITIPSSVTRIYDYAFSGCTGLTGITIPASVFILESDTFSGCTGLNSIDVDNGNPQYSSVAGVLFNAGGTILIQYPPGKSGPYSPPSSVTIIGDYAFYDCIRLTSITIPPSVTSIRGNAFSGCTGLTRITMPASVTSIESSAFHNCSGLTSITIPASITNIDLDAFYGCRGLTNALFEGNAPISFHSDTFRTAAGGFTLFYYEGSTGFTSLPGIEYPVVAVARPGATTELRVGTFTLAGGMATLRAMGGRLGWTYELQSSPKAVPTSWTPVGTLGPLAADGPVELTAPIAPAAQGFYRLVGRAQ